MMLNRTEALDHVVNVRGYMPEPGTDDASEQIVVEILGVEVSVRRRRTDDGVETYVHIDTENLADEHRPLVVEVDNGGENTYGDCLWAAQAPDAGQDEDEDEDEDEDIEPGTPVLLTGGPVSLLARRDAEMTEVAATANTGDTGVYVGPLGPDLHLVRFTVDDRALYARISRGLFAVKIDV